MKTLKKTAFLSFCVLGMELSASLNWSQISSQNEWKMSHYIKKMRTHPEEIFSELEKLRTKERLEEVSKTPALSGDWQSRYGLAYALSELFAPDYSVQFKERYAEDAKKHLTHMLIEDPALLVRDASVESIRRILRMNPNEAQKWKKILEQAFLDSKNTQSNSGLFIKVTVLHALREASLRPSARVLKNAKRDKNPDVRKALELWDTRSF